MITIPRFRELPPEQRIVVLMQVEANRQKRNQIDRLYLDEGPHKRALYQKHLAFFEAGTVYRERGVMAANQIGKSFGMGAYETALHLTGVYPEWWQGRKFARPISGIAAGKTNTTTRDIVQAYLFGSVIHNHDGSRSLSGTGLIRGDCIKRVNWKSGGADMIDTAMIMHASGKLSLLTIRSYEQGRAAFEGLVRDWIWLDEEPPSEIYAECLIRTATTDGSVVGTFTPLDGITETVKQFLPSGLMAKLCEGGDVAHVKEAVSGLIRINDSRCTIMVGWGDVPHLTEKAKADLIRGVPAYQIKARSMGIPSLGDGAIFPVDETTISISPIQIPDHWVRICGMDFGWDHPTAAIWLAYDREADVIYVIDEYAASRTVVPLHASAINARGKWIPVAWPHDGYQVKDMMNGEQVAQQYRNEDVNMRPLHAQFVQTPGSKEVSSVISVEAGLMEMLTRMQTGRWKVFNTCTGWFDEFRIYRREKGRIVKEIDDRISASRYGMMDIRYAITKPAEQRRLAAVGGRKHPMVL